jgi:hypothetical protein
MNAQFNFNLISFDNLPSEYNIKFRNENICLKILIKDKLSSLSHQKNDIILVDILLFHGILQMNMFKILTSNLLFLRLKILTTFHHQNIISFNQNMQSVVIHVMVLSLEVIVVMMLLWIINLIKILIVIQNFLFHIQI